MIPSLLGVIFLSLLYLNEEEKYKVKHCCTITQHSTLFTLTLNPKVPNHILPMPHLVIPPHPYIAWKLKISTNLHKEQMHTHTHKHMHTLAPHMAISCQ